MDFSPYWIPIWTSPHTGSLYGLLPILDSYMNFSPDWIPMWTSPHIGSLYRLLPILDPYMDFSPYWIPIWNSPHIGSLYGLLPILDPYMDFSPYWIPILYLYTYIWMIESQFQFIQGLKEHSLRLILKIFKRRLLSDQIRVSDDGSDKESIVCHLLVLSNLCTIQRSLVTIPLLIY